MQTNDERPLIDRPADEQEQITHGVEVNSPESTRRAVPEPTSIKMDGDQWHAHYGAAFPEGVSGFGATQDEAREDFTKNYLAQQTAGSPFTGAPSADTIKGLVSQFNKAPQDGEPNFLNAGVLLANDGDTRLLLVEKERVHMKEKDAFGFTFVDGGGFSAMMMTPDKWRAMKAIVDRYIADNFGTH